MDSLLLKAPVQKNWLALESTVQNHLQFRMAECFFEVANDYNDYNLIGEGVMRCYGQKYTVLQ